MRYRRVWIHNGVDIATETAWSRDDCAQPEMIVHELGHLIGLWHEHSRYDRHAHVSIALDNVRSVHRYNFDKLPGMRLMAPYDLSSIMHYGLKVSLDGFILRLQVRDCTNAN